MSHQSILSICIPTYNRKNKLEKTLEVLMPQSKNYELEIIVSDNASDDGTEEYCQRKSIESSCLKYYRQTRNIGFSNNLIFALSKASGQYLWMLGDDEVLHPDSVTRIVEFLMKSNPSWLVCNFVKLDSPDAKWPSEGYIKNGREYRALTVQQVLKTVGIWASFMSINIVRADRFQEWYKSNKGRESEYIGFDVVLAAGNVGNCAIIRDPILGRVKGSLNAHRFNKISVYLFQFFDPIDSLVDKKLLSPKLRMSLTREMFFSMAGYLLLRAKIKKQALPAIKDCVRYHAKVPVFWYGMLPLLLMPSWFVKCAIAILKKVIPNNSGSKLSRLIDNLN